MNPVPPVVATSTTAIAPGDESSSEDHYARVSGSIRPSDPSFEVPELKRRRRQDGWLRQDGDPTRVNDPGGLYGQKYVDAERAVREALEADPNYQFVRMVAGNTDAQIEDYYEVSAVQEEVRRRVLRAQQTAVEQRQSLDFIRVLRTQLADQEKLLAEKKQDRDDHIADRRDLEAGRDNYKAARDLLAKALDFNQYLALPRAQQRAQILAPFDTSKPTNNFIRTSFGAALLFDFLTRGAVIEHGLNGYAGEPFRRQIESIVDRACGKLPDGQDDIASVKKDIPLTSRLALYLATLEAVMQTPQLFQKAMELSDHRQGSQYDSEPSTYGGDLEVLHSLIFGAFVEDGANYLYYGDITLGLYIHLGLMHRRSGSLLPRVERPTVPGGGGGGASRRRRNIGGVDVIIDIEDDELEKVDLTTDEADQVLTEQQKRQYRNKPLPAANERAAGDALSLLVELLKPMFDAVFPFVFYSAAALESNSRELSFGGRPGDFEPLRVLDIGSNPADGRVDSLDPIPAQGEMPQLVIETRSGRSRRGKSKFAPSGARVSLVGTAFENLFIGEEYSSFVGVLFLAIGIFEHAMRESTTAQTTRFLVTYGFARGETLVGEIVDTLALDEAQAQKYLDNYRKRRVIDDLLPQVAVLLSTVERAAPEASANSRLTTDDLELLRRFIRLDASDPDYKRTSEAAFEVYEKRLGSDGAKALPAASQTALIKTMSNQRLNNLVDLGDYDNALIDARAKVTKIDNKITGLESEIDGLRDDIEKRVKQTDEEVKDRLERGLQPSATVDPRVAMSVANTGVVRLTPMFSAALASAFEKVRMYVDGLQQATFQQLQRNTHYRTAFAQLVANEIHSTRIRFPDVYRTQNAQAQQLRQEQTIINNLRMAVARQRGVMPGVMAYHRHTHAMTRHPVQFASSHTYGQQLSSSSTRGYFS